MFSLALKNAILFVLIILILHFLIKNFMLRNDTNASNASRVAPATPVAPMQRASSNRVVQEEMKTNQICPSPTSVPTFPNVDNDEDELRKFVFNTKAAVPLYSNVDMNVANASNAIAQPFLPCQQKNYNAHEMQQMHQMPQMPQMSQMPQMQSDQLGTFSKCDYSKYGSLLT